MVPGPAPPARHGPALGPAAPHRGTRRLSETGAGMRRSEGGGGARGLRAAASLPQLARGRGEEGGGRRSPCLLVALRPRNVEAERERFFRASFAYDPQFEYAEPPPAAVLEKYGEASDRFVTQAIRIIRAVLEKYGTYESFEVATGGRLLSKCQIWAMIRKYMQKEGCVGEVVVQLTDDLLSQAVMMVEDSRPTLAINLAGARQHWLEGMLRHEIGTHYIRGVNNTRQPWHSSEGRKQYSLKPANPTEEGLASLHSVLFRKQPFLWRAALLYYTIERASRLSFSALFQDLEQYVQDAGVRWEYCVRAKRGQTDTSQPGCFSKDQVYLDGILRILRHRQTIDFPLLAALGKPSSSWVSSPCFPSGLLRRCEQAEEVWGAGEGPNPPFHAGPGEVHEAAGSHCHHQWPERGGAGAAAARLRGSSPQNQCPESSTSALCWIFIGAGAWRAEPGPPAPCPGGHCACRAGGVGVHVSCPHCPLSILGTAP